MDKTILRRSVIIIALIIGIFAISGCGCPAGTLCCGGEECEGASEDDSCCGSLCPCTGTASKCCSGGPNSNGICCDPSRQHCKRDTVWHEDVQQYSTIWSCALCADGQKQCGQVCIGNDMCCTDGKAGCPSPESCYDCNAGVCEEKTGTCSYAGNCPIPPGEQSGHSDQCSGYACAGCINADPFPCPGETEGSYRCAFA